MANSLIGRMLGNYKVLDLLGHGGMATVYLGYQENVDRQVAIKVLPPHPGLDPQFIERFRTEARTIARLQHPHILPLYDYGNQDDILYLVMAYISGGTLADRVAKGPMPAAEALRLLREIASAMDYAHRQEVIHRDIKPGNILIDGDGHALLADFGIARVAGGANLTGTSTVGTPAYMAPEQARGDVVDHRADVYALGVVTYQMLTGQQPFIAETPMQLLLKVIDEEPPDIMQVMSGLPSEVGQVMKIVMAKDPDARYQTASEFTEAFSKAVHEAATVPELRRASPANVLGTPKDTAKEGAATLDMAAGQTRTAKDTAEQVARRAAEQAGNQTIIVQHNTNPVILLGGFALIAVALVAALVFIFTSQNNNQTDTGGRAGVDVSPTGESATEVAAVAQAEQTPTLTPVPISDVFGRVSFGTASTRGDSLSLQVNGLTPTGSGQVYVAWLSDASGENVLKIGDLVLDPLGSGSVTYIDSEGRLLPGTYNIVALSIEATGSTPDTPQGEIRYRGSVPPEVTALLNQTLVASEKGLNGGSLLDGAITEADLAVRHSGLAASATSLGGMKTHAEHTINILRGERVDYDGAGGGQNPGRGVGVYFFITEIEALLNAAVNAPEVSQALQSDAELIRVCLANARTRADRMIALEEQLLAAQDIATVSAQAAESTTVGQALIDGIDLNENGQVEAFEDECGLRQIETFAIVIGGITLLEVEE